MVDFDSIVRPNNLLKLISTCIQNSKFNLSARQPNSISITPLPTCFPDKHILQTSSFDDSFRTLRANNDFDFFSFSHSQGKKREEKKTASTQLFLFKKKKTIFPFFLSSHHHTRTSRLRAQKQNSAETRRNSQPPTPLLAVLSFCVILEK